MTVRNRRTTRSCLVSLTMVLAHLLTPGSCRAADHNDPNGVNSIFSDIDLSPADLYDFFGFPGNDPAGGETVVVALTFAPIPKTGVFDRDLLYRILLDPGRRATSPLRGEPSLEALLEYADAIKDKYLKVKSSEIRVTFDQQNRAKLNFIGFPGASFAMVVETNKVLTVETPDGHSIKAYIGGRDDAFFNDLPGFFRSINYAPQFYHVPHTMADTRELAIPKTLLELEGNTLFNFNPENPRHGQGVKLDLPSGSMTWSGSSFLKDENGNYRFVYSGRDAQAGINVNAIILEMPLAFLTKSPREDRIVSAWGESWVLKAANKVETIPDEGPSRWRSWLLPGATIVLGVVLVIFGLRSSRKAAAASAGGPSVKWWGRPKTRIAGGVVVVALGVGLGMLLRFLGGPMAADLDEELKQYKLVDTDGVPFSDAALSERENDRQLGANNMKLARHFVIRTAHLGWGFGPSIDALGLRSSFDHDDSPISVHKTYKLAVKAFPRVKKTLFQRMNMPDDSWNKSGVDIELKRAFEIFIPNVCAIDMDTTGTWPFGRRPEDQVASRFLAIFLDMDQMIGGKKCHIDTLGDQSFWDQAPIEPKTPPNPLKNDKEFLDHFPYLADPWP